MKHGEPSVADSRQPVDCEHCRHYRPFQFCGGNDNHEAACLHPGNVIGRRSRLSTRRDPVDGSHGRHYDNRGIPTRSRLERINLGCDCPNHAQGPDLRVQGQMGCAVVAIGVIFGFVILAILGEPWMAFLGWLGINPIHRTDIP